MLQKRIRFAAFTALLLGCLAAVAVGLLGLPTAARAAESTTIAVRPKLPDIFFDRDPARPGLRVEKEGVLYVPRKLAKRNPVLVILDNPARGKGLLETLQKALDAHGLIGIAPAAPTKNGQPDLNAMAANLEALIKKIHADQNVPTDAKFALVYGQGASIGYRFAFVHAKEFRQMVFVATPKLTLDKKTLAAATKTPILLVSGQADKTIPIGDSTDTHKALTTAGLTVTLKSIAKADHDSLLKAHAGEYLDWLVPTAQRPKQAQPVVVKDLAGATRLVIAGRFRDAIDAYRKLMAQKELKLAAGIALADTQQIVGDYAQAVKTLEDLRTLGAKDAAWQVAYAEALECVGQYDSALQHAAEANRLRPTWAPSILVRGRLLETLGQKKEALAVYATMNKVVEGDDYRKDARSLVALGRIMDRHSILSGKRASSQASNILNTYFRQAYRVDPNYWPARVAAGEFLLAKHREEAAYKEFSEAGKKFHNLPSIHVGQGAALVSVWQFEKCLQQADAALKVNPNNPDAHLLKAACLMQWRKFDQVPDVLGKLLKVNPNHLDGLSMMAAVYIRTYEPAKAQPYIHRVLKVNPHYAGLYSTIGEWLSAGRQFRDAEKYFKKAIDTAPELADAYASLGRMYTQTGQEDKAIEYLDKAHALDDFRADVVNFLNILKRIKTRFRVKETEHFIVKVDPQYDMVLLDQMAEYLEKIHAEVCEDFAFEPKEKTIIEVMPTHKQFSIRIAGKAWIGTVGASTGRVIVLAAPNQKRSELGLHNWATVLRHEYTHTVTLAATGSRIPHWFTEACAVWQQPDKRNYRFVQMLVAATRANRLFPIKELDWGFIRPKRAGDRTLAYAQAEWVMEYIISQYGYAAVPNMLRGFRDKLTQKEVFRKVLNIGESEFDGKFRQWARKTVQEWGFSVDPPIDMAKAIKAAKENPKDADAQADLAHALIARGQFPPAEKQARKALALAPDNAKALGVLCYALMRAKKHDEAIKYARKLESVDHTGVIAPRVLADSFMAKRSWLQAAQALELLKQRRPLESYPYENLAKIYTQLGMPEKALPNLLHLHRHTMRDPKYARQIAEIYRDDFKDSQALAYFEQILHINPYETSAYQAIASIQMRLKQYDDAVKAVERMILLEPRSANSWNYMAAVRWRIGRQQKNPSQLEKARDAATKALELDPGNSQAQQLKDAIEASLRQFQPN